MLGTLYDGISPSARNRSPFEVYQAHVSLSRACHAGRRAPGPRLAALPAPTRTSNSSAVSPSESRIPISRHRGWIEREAPARQAHGLQHDRRVRIDPFEHGPGLLCSALFVLHPDSYSFPSSSPDSTLVRSYFVLLSCRQRRRSLYAVIHQRPLFPLLSSFRRSDASLSDACRSCLDVFGTRPLLANTTFACESLLLSISISFVLTAQGYRLRSLCIYFTAFTRVPFMEILPGIVHGNTDCTPERDVATLPWRDPPNFE